MITAFATGTEAANTAAATTGAGMGYTGIIYIVLMIVLFYFMLIRPQKKKEKQVKAMLAALKPGDSVTTIGGIVGKVLRIKDDKVCIEIGDRTHKHPMTLKREAISSVVPCTKSTKKAEIFDEIEEPEFEANEKAEIPEI